MLIKIALTIAVLLVLGYILYRWYKNRENFDAPTTKQPDLNIKPLLYDKFTGTVMSGSEFIGLPSEIIPAWGATPIKNYGRVDGLDDGAHGNFSMDFNMCSKSCCSKQFPPGFATDHDVMVCNSKDKFVGSQYTCNNSWQDSGCLCMTEDQRNFLAKRGNNA
jgi:hypothetical protein